MIRIFIADDHPVVRSGLRAVLTAETDFDIVGEASEARGAIDAAQQSPIDVVTMDLRFPHGLTGVEATRELRALDTPPAVLVLTNYDDDSDILGAIEAGASGYLLKDSPPDSLTAAVRDAHAGRTILAPVVATRLVTRMREPQVELTGRERDVLNAIDRGLSNREIGAELYLSQTTVKTHLARLYGKLGVSSRTAALARARERGLLR